MQQQSTDNARLRGLFVLGFISVVSRTEASDCWIDLYDRPNFSGSHVHLEGPLDMPSLSDVNGEVWSNRVESLLVGPKAQLIVFKAEDFNVTHAGPLAHPDAFQAWGESEVPAYHDLEISFGPDKRESHLADLHFHKSINSLKILCP